MEKLLKEFEQVREKLYKDCENEKISRDAYRILSNKIFDIECDLKTPKKVTEEQIESFLNQTYNYIELYADKENEYFKIKFDAKYMDDILLYWRLRGYGTFQNLLLVFKN